MNITETNNIIREFYTKYRDQMPPDVAEVLR